jgi:PAS domain S-box-containing protein
MVKIEAILHPDDRIMFMEEVERVRAGEPKSLEFRIVHRNGELRWICSRALPLRDIDGSIIGIHGVAADVTARKEASAELLPGIPAHATRSPR